jgi:uncharacterized FAD-dependent dehydrogenase
MNKHYDVAIIGCGEAGIYAGYELKRRNPELQVVILDRGRDIYHRSCPIVAGKVKECINCPVCDTMCGFGGAGAFSDGKFNFTTDFGGWLTDFYAGAGGYGPDRIRGRDQRCPRRHRQGVFHRYPGGQSAEEKGAGI